MELEQQESKKLVNVSGLIGSPLSFIEINETCVNKCNLSVRTNFTRYISNSEWRISTLEFNSVFDQANHEISFLFRLIKFNNLSSNGSFFVN
jgi:hypothetical protein